jgi:hypothetical protein
MELYKRVLYEDLKVYNNGLKLDNFQFCNIISNRIITNACIIKSKEFILIGAILKEILPDFQVFDEDIIKKAKNDLSKMVENFINEEDLKSKYIINNYSEFFNSYRQFITEPFEDYEENKGFTSETVKYCLDFLIKELEELKIPHQCNILIYGVLNEIRRVIKSFGCSHYHLMLRLLLSFFGKLYDNFRFIMLNNLNSKDFWENKYNKFREILIDNLRSFDIVDEYIVNSSNLLFDICVEWRYMFMRIMELPRLEQKRYTKIPPNVEDQLKEMVSQITKSELKGE